MTDQFGELDPHYDIEPPPIPEPPPYPPSEYGEAEPLSTIQGQVTAAPSPAYQNGTEQPPPAVTEHYVTVGQPIEQIVEQHQAVTPTYPAPILGEVIIQPPVAPPTPEPSVAQPQVVAAPPITEPQVVVTPAPAPHTVAEPAPATPFAVEPIIDDPYAVPSYTEEPDQASPWGPQAVPVGVEPIAEKPRREKSLFWRLIPLVVAVALLSAIASSAITSYYMPRATDTITTVEKLVTAPSNETLGEDTGTDLSVNVAAKVIPSVVSIAVTQEQMTMFGTMTAEGSGSGVIIKDDGYILTNYHVIEGGTNITVTANREEYTATIVGVDASSDLAVLKIDAKDLTEIVIGTSGDLKVGQYVMAVGSPFGLSESVSVGIISALGRTEAFQMGNEIAAYANLIQTDAAINPGNSGGALVDAAGRLIGINTLIKTTSGSSAGVGFAIPVDTALDIANQLMAGGTVSHSFLGVATQTVDAMSATQFDLPVEEGAYVVEVVAGSPAQKAGLERSDIIVKIGDRTVKTSEDVFAAVRSHREGDTVTVEYYRDGVLKTVEVTLGNDATSAQSSYGIEVS